MSIYWIEKELSHMKTLYDTLLKNYETEIKELRLKCNSNHIYINELNQNYETIVKAMYKQPLRSVQYNAMICNDMQ